MKQALGLVEIEGLSTAVVAADTMSKAAAVRLLELENAKGLGYMTIKITGDVGAVKAAVKAGCQLAGMYGRLVSGKVIPRPSDFVEQVFGGSVLPVTAVSPAAIENRGMDQKGTECGTVETKKGEIRQCIKNSGE